MPVTYPSSVSGWTTYDHKPVEQYPPNAHDYLFPFGHGLSYTSFTYSDLRLNTHELAAPNAQLQITVLVKNTGPMSGKETIVLYLNDEVGSLSRPVKQMKQFKKIYLSVNETRSVAFTLSLEDMMFYDQHGKRVYEAGYFNVYVGNLTSRFVLKNDSRSLKTVFSAGWLISIIAFLVNIV
jgi:beta-glucosidase